MKDLTLSRLIGTLKNTFRINRLTIDASALTAGRVIYAPDSDIHLGGMLGEIRSYTGELAPDGWMFCNGQLLLATNYPALFDVIGSTYGGDGITHFKLPSYHVYGAGSRHIIFVDRYGSQQVQQVTVPAAIHGLNGAGDVLYFAVQLLESVTVTNGPPKLSVTMGANTYLLSQSAATSTAWEYEYVVQATDFGEVTAAIDLNGATLASAGVPVNLSSYYTPGTLLSMQSAETLMTPTADTNVITQIQLLSGSAAGMTPTSGGAAITQIQLLAGTVSTMTPTADTNAITIT